MGETKPYLLSRYCKININSLLYILINHNILNLNIVPVEVDGIINGERDAILNSRLFQILNQPIYLIWNTLDPQENN